MIHSTSNTNPFTVVYSFEIKENTMSDFVDAWTSLTQLIYEFEGSYGSRLHKVNDTHFVGYAQWPSRLVFEQSGNHLPEIANVYRSKMRACCVKIEKLLELESVEIDLIQNKQHDRLNP